MASHPRTRVRNRTPLKCCAPKGDSTDVGMIAVFLFKRNIKDWLLKKLEVFAWAIELKQRIKLSVETAPAMRATMGFADDPSQYPLVDISGRGNIFKSADLFWGLFEKLVYGYKSDPIIQTAVRGRKSAEDFFSMTDVECMLAEVNAAYAKEQGQPVVEPDAEDEQNEDADMTETKIETAIELLDISKSTTELILDQATTKAEHRDEMENFRQAVLRDIKKTIHLIEEGENQDDLNAAFKTGTAQQVKGNCKTKEYVTIILDAFLLCECGNQAKYRSPPARQHQITKLCTGFLSTRENGELDLADVLVTPDGGKGKVFDDKIMLGMNKPALVQNEWFAMYDHASIVARMERDSGNVIDQLGRIVYYAKNAVDIKHRNRWLSFIKSLCPFRTASARTSSEKSTSIVKYVLLLISGFKFNVKLRYSCFRPVFDSN